ncbi:MAG: hypothetical protein LBV26_05655 [Bacteroidales bacterium]|jgi:hypothetical protein|nr:hypothetical protein [Bacteroidales bacterium]
MKNLISLVCISLLSTTLSFAQEKGKLRTGVEFGMNLPRTSGFGAQKAMELKYNIRKNMMQEFIK